MKKIAVFIGSAFFAYGLIANNAFAGFGAQKVVEYVKPERLFAGTGATYVTFSGPALAGCASGGYITSSWPEANVGVDDSVRANRFISAFLFAKAQGLLVEVRYRINDTGTGWNNCAIDAIWMY